MTACSVLRCLKPASDSVALPPYADREVPVCAEHKASLDGGAPWRADPGHALVALRDPTVDLTIFMGQDIPLEPRLGGFGLSPTIGSETGFSLDLTIDAADGQQRISFWMTKEEGTLLASWIAEDQHDR